MSSCKPSSSKNILWQQVLWIYQWLCEGTFTFVPFEPGSTNHLVVPPNTVAGSHITELTPIHILNAQVSFLWLLFLFLFGFGFSPLCFIGKGQLEKWKKGGERPLFGGYFFASFFYTCMSISVSSLNVLTQFTRILHQLQWDLGSVSSQPSSYCLSRIRQMQEATNKDHPVSKVCISLTELVESPL